MVSRDLNAVRDRTWNDKVMKPRWLLVIALWLIEGKYVTRSEEWWR
jgi:hypothetical protein